MTARRTTTRRRAFTLLETLLAAVIAGVILTGALAILDVIRRADILSIDRAERTQSMARVQITVRDALDSLVLEPASNDAPGPPRFLLERRVVDGEPTQRLELVLSRPLFDPIEEQDRRALLQNSDPRLLTIDDLNRHRGAFELVNDETGKALIWRRLPPIDLPEGFSFDERTLPPPVVLARNLTGLRWKAFENRVRQETFSAAQDHDLPAYVELELIGQGGPGASFVFAVNWIRDSALTEIQTPDLDDEGEDDGENPEGPDEIGGVEVPEELRETLRGFDPSILDNPGGGAP